MSEAEKQFILSIDQAYSNAIQLVNNQNVPTNPKDINTTINISELSVRRIVSFFKLVPDFRDLPHKLTLKLLKHNIMNLLQVHGVISFNRTENIFKQPNTDDVPFNADSLKVCYGEEIAKIIIETTNNFNDLCRENMTFIRILMLIIVFDPENDCLEPNEKLLITELENKYFEMLYSCICEKYGKVNAEVTVKSLILELNKIKSLSKFFKEKIDENSNHEKIHPLMLEVFSIENTKSQTVEIAEIISLLNM